MLMRERTLINVFNFPVSCFANYLIIRIVIFPSPPFFYRKRLPEII